MSAAANAAAARAPWMLWAAFVGVSLTWGGSFLFMKLALEGLSAFQVAFGRNLLGGLALVLWVLAARQDLRLSLKAAGHTVVVAVTLYVLPGVLFAWAETQISSGLASIYNATTPIMTVLVAVAAWRGGALRKAQSAAIAVGMAGVIIVAVPSISGGGSWLAHAACLLATACYGFAYEYLGRFVVQAGQSPLVPTMWQLVFAAAILAPGLLLPGQLHADFTPAVSFGIVALGVIGSGLACVWNNLLVAEWSATRAAMSMYVTPCVGVILGWMVLGESLTWNLPLGLALVLGAVALDSRAARAAKPSNGSAGERGEVLEPSPR